MTMTDVNAQFDAERAAQQANVTDYNKRAAEWNAMTPEQRQSVGDAERLSRFETAVALGKMRNLGGGRYEVNDPGSWDNGEVFRVTRADNGTRQMLVMPEHGLDSFYSMYPEWHDFGTIIPAGLSHIPSVLKAAGIYFEVFQRPAGGWQDLTDTALRNKWFKLHPDEYESADDVPDHVFIEERGKFQNYRSDTLATLGVVGKIHTSIQPAQSMEFLQKLVDDQSVLIQSAGALGGGTRIFLDCLLPEDMIIDAEGVADHVELHVIILDRFDGQGKFMAIVTPWRCRCRNTERLALLNAVTSWGVRHTTRAKDRADEAMRTLKLTRAYAAEFVKEETALVHTAITEAELKAIIDEVFDRPEDESKKQATVNGTRENEILAKYESYAADLGRTAYAAERAMTDYLDHGAPRRVKSEAELKAARVTAAFLGSDDDRKDATHKALMRRMNYRA
jgi:phage/plasmid-like protein (TIGR03299 family)